MRLELTLRHTQPTHSVAIMKVLMLSSLLASIVLASSLYIEARPTEQQSTELQARFGNVISELEWLLHQLVNILTDMVDGIEKEPSLLQNYHFRQILIHVIKRIDYILEHFENVGTTVLTSTVLYELQRIDCVRIRLANYISQSKKYDDSQCRSSNEVHKPGSSPSSDQVLPLLTQIVSLLVKVTQQLDYISHLKDVFPTSDHHKEKVTTTTALPMWTKPAIDWEELISAYVSSKPSTMPNNGTETTTQNWSDLISQVMGSMGNTLTPPSSTMVTSTTAPTASTVWEDIMNDLINQWSGSASTLAPSNGNNVDVQQCVNSILSMISTIQNQMPNSTIFTGGQQQ